MGSCSNWKQICENQNNLRFFVKTVCDVAQLSRRTNNQKSIDDVEKIYRERGGGGSEWRKKRKGGTIKCSKAEGEGGGYE